MKHDIDGAKDGSGSLAGGRFVLGLFGLIFLLFGLREISWRESPGVVGVMCIIASLPFFGSRSIIQSLFKRRGVPSED
ncbi:hypothetical protein GO613_22530 [Azoarcus communis]|uniref:hypothetical protein n=1 Tax=Parazoarcus communis TaxID=41977 RepID=UPI0014596090|nr:hypothetical protein [Parazoarcus communis]NMG50873.1 hypothetical protein [Parazoarcus communis]